MKIAHLITGLNRGGAETMLYRLMKHRKYLYGEQIVISMMSDCTMEKDFRELGIRVYTLGMKRGRGSVLAVINLIKILKAEKINLLQTWMYHADLLGVIVYKIAGVKYLVWNICCSDLELDKYPKLTTLVIRLCAKLSSIPNAVISNSEKGINVHKDFRYRPKRWKLIYNGFETELYSSGDRAEKQLFRRKFKIPENAYVIGMAARYDFAKDFETLLKSIEYFYRKRKSGDTSVVFALCGKNVCRENPQLLQLAEKLGIEKSLFLLGELSNITEFYAMLDAFVLSSRTEGLPNVLGEAMASGLPVVTTNAGDSAKICSDIGFVTNTGDYKGLALGYEKVLSLDDDELDKLSKRSQIYIRDNFSIEKITKKYNNLYNSIKQTNI